MGWKTKKNEKKRRKYTHITYLVLFNCFLVFFSTEGLYVRVESRSDARVRGANKVIPHR